ncbi:MAG: DeoR/GlpR family DNA-binding transcription regulator [Kiloniellales bacterium]
MAVSVRQSEILRLVRQQGSCTIGELAERLAVSDETIRRNVKPLVSEGLVLKVHGGIILPDRFQEAPIQRRMQDHREAKERIAALVARQIRDGDSLILDTGSTTTYVAKALMEHSNLVVVTNSPQIAGTLATRNGNRVFMAGGELRAHDAAAFGAETIDFVRRFQLRTAILSMGAVHAEQGFMVYHLCEAEFSRAAIGQSERCIVAADSSKFDHSTLARVCPLDEVDLLVTEAAPPPALAHSLAAAQVEVLVADGSEYH